MTELLTRCIIANIFITVIIFIRVSVSLLDSKLDNRKTTSLNFCIPRES